MLSLVFAAGLVSSILLVRFLDPKLPLLTLAHRLAVVGPSLAVAVMQAAQNTPMVIPATTVISG